MMNYQGHQKLRDEERKLNHQGVAGVEVLKALFSA